MYIIRLPQKARIPSEGIVSQWLVSKGNSIEKGTIIARLEVFGQTVELESPVSAALLEILTPAGAVAYGRQPLAVLGNNGDDIQSVLNSLAPKAPVAAPVAQVVPVTKQTQIEAVIETKKEVKM